MLFCDSMERKTPNPCADVGLKHLPTIREWTGYPLVRDFKPTVFIADFTYVSEEGVFKVGFRILASFVATKNGRTLWKGNRTPTKQNKMPLIRKAIDLEFTVRFDCSEWRNILMEHKVCIFTERGKKGKQLTKASLTEHIKAYKKI